MIKIILFDIDGVLIRVPYYFPSKLQEQGYVGALDILNQYYRSNDQQLCKSGKLNPINCIEPYLKKIGWKKETEVYFFEQYEFEKSFLDYDLLNQITNIRLNGIKCFLASDQDRHRTHFLLNDLNLNEYFDGHYISCNLGYCKNHQKYWKYVIQDLRNQFQNHIPENIFFIDDNKDNLLSASKIGIKTYLIKDQNSIIDFIALVL